MSGKHYLHIQDSKSSCINHNKFVRSLTTSLKFCK